jgi:ankyrin repeat protein
MLGPVDCTDHVTHDRVLKPFTDRELVDAVVAKPRNTSWREFYRSISSDEWVLRAPYYSAKYDRPTVERVLLAMPWGAYVCRPSSTSRTDIVLSVHRDGRVLHHLIIRLGEHRGLMLMGKLHRTLGSLLLTQRAVELTVPLLQTVATEDAFHTVKRRVGRLIRLGAAVSEDDASAALLDAAKWGVGPSVVRRMLKTWGGADVTLGDDAAATFLARSGSTSTTRTTSARGERRTARSTPRGDPSPSQGDTEMHEIPVLQRHRSRMMPVSEAFASQASNSSTLEKVACTLDLERRDSTGKTALHWAARPLRPRAIAGAMHVLSVLLQAGADPNVRDADGRTPLLLAVEVPEPSLGSVRVLLAAGANPAIEVDGKNFLHVCVARNHEALVRLFVGPRINLSWSNRHGDTLLHTAARYGRAAIMTMLVEEFDYDPNARNVEGETPIFAAITRSQDWISLHLFGRPWRSMYNWQVLQYLLANRGNSALANCRGETALHVAAAAGHRSCTRTLLENGAPPDARDEQGRTPLDLARLGVSSYPVRAALLQMQELSALGMRTSVADFRTTVESCYGEVIAILSGQLTALEEKEEMNGTLH